MGGILVIAELRDRAPSPLTRELLGLARELANDAVGALVFTARSEAASSLASCGADRVYWCGHDEEYEGELWLAMAERVVREIAPLAVLVGHTPTGAELGPRLAFRLGTGVATGCTAIGVESGKLLFTRACFGGNVRETLSFSAAPAVATVRSGVGATSADGGRQGDVIRVPTPEIAPRVRVVAREREATDTTRLEDARIIVAGGRGLEGPEGFRVIEDLARALGAAVGASRVPCDLGWCPHALQIGLTGKTVCPDLYIAVGISGAGQHMAGCGNAKTIVAINTDAEAAIFRDARFGLIGDYRKLVPALAAAIAALKRDSVADSAE